MSNRKALTAIMALSLVLVLLLTGLSPANAKSVNFQVQVVKADFSGLAGVPVEVRDESTLVTTEFTNSAGDVFFSLSPGTYEFRAGNASATASVVTVPAAALVGVILMPTNHYLRVQTDPVDLVDIKGGGWYDECGSVDLIAPMTVTKDYTLYLFNYWDLDGESQGVGFNSIAIHMDASHRAIAHYTKLISINKELVWQSHDPIPTNTKVDFVMTVTLHAYEPVTGVTVTDGIGADLVLDDYSASTDSVTVERPGKGKAGATKVTWTIGTPEVCVDYTLELSAHTGLNPQGKQQYATPGEKKLNSGPVVYFTYEGTLYQIQGPSVKVTAVE